MYPPPSGSVQKTLGFSEAAHSHLLLQGKPRQMCSSHSCSGVAEARAGAGGSQQMPGRCARATASQQLHSPLLQPLHVTCPGGHRSTLKAVGSSPTYAMQTPLPTLMLLPAHKELFPHTVGPIELRSKRTLWPTQTWQENVSWYQKYLFSPLYNKLSLAFSKLSVCLIFWESFITLTTNNYVSLPAILFRMA